MTGKWQVKDRYLPVTPYIRKRKRQENDSCWPGQQLSFACSSFSGRRLSEQVNACRFAVPPVRTGLRQACTCHDRFAEKRKQTNLSWSCPDRRTPVMTGWRYFRIRTFSPRSLGVGKTSTICYCLLLLVKVIFPTVPSVRGGDRFLLTTRNRGFPTMHDR